MQTTFTAISSNWVCWAILGLAFSCYYQLGLRTLLGKKPACNHTLVLIGALPLLGLFGTIAGLLDCFAAMARGQAGEALTGGIGDALFTTQLGLTCALPAWIWHAWVCGCEAKPKPTEVSHALAS